MVEEDNEIAIKKNVEQNEKDAQKQPQQAASDFVGANANKKEEASSSRPRNSNVAVAQIISTQQQREDIPVNKPLSSLPINSRVLLKNKDDDSSNMKMATIKKVLLDQTPPQLRVHVDGKRKGILDTIGFEDIHSVIGICRHNSSGHSSSSNSSSHCNTKNSQQIATLPPDEGTPLISSFGYHMKFCMWRQKKKNRHVRPQHRIQPPPGGFQFFDLPTSLFSSTFGVAAIDDAATAATTAGAGAGAVGYGSPGSHKTAMSAEDLFLMRRAQEQRQLVAASSSSSTATNYNYNNGLLMQQQQQQQSGGGFQLPGAAGGSSSVATFGSGGGNGSGLGHNFPYHQDSFPLPFMNNNTSSSSSSLFNKISSGIVGGGGGGFDAGVLFGGRNNSNSKRTSSSNANNDNLMMMMMPPPFNRRPDLRDVLTQMNETSELSTGVTNEKTTKKKEKKKKKADATTMSTNTSTTGGGMRLGTSMALPPSAFSALDSLAPELRERMLRLSKLNDDGVVRGGGNDNNDCGNNNDSIIMIEAELRNRTKKELIAGEGVDDNLKDKLTKKTKTQHERTRCSNVNEKEERSLASGDVGGGVCGGNSTSNAAGIASYSAMGRNRLLPSPAPFKRKPLIDARSSLLSGGSNDIMGQSLTFNRMISSGSAAAGGNGGGGGCGIDNFQDRMNMMQFMGVRPPFGGADDGGGLRLPFGGFGDGGGIRPPFGGLGDSGGLTLPPPFGAEPASSTLKRKYDSSISLDISATPRFDAEANDRMLAALESFKKIGKKYDSSVPSVAAVASILDGAKDGSRAAESQLAALYGEKRKDVFSYDKDSSKKKSVGKKIKRSSTKGSTGGDVDKPKRPFSAYNLFFQLEREFIMGIIADGGNPREDPLIKAAVEVLEEANAKGEGMGKGTSVKMDEKRVKQALEMDEKRVKQGFGGEDIKDVDVIVELSGTGTPPPQISLPQRYKHMKLEDHWYCVSRKVKRKHRKTEGSCGFLELNKMVSARWKTVECTDPQVKEWCQKVADNQLETYKKDVAEYKEGLAANDSRDYDADSTQTEASPHPGEKPAADKPTAMGMGVNASPFDFGKMQHGFFDPRMSHIGRLADLSQAAQMSIMPPLPTLQSVPPPPFSSSTGGMRRMDVRQPSLRMDGFGSDRLMGGFGDQSLSSQQFNSEAQSFLDPSRGMGGFPSNMMLMNQSDIGQRNQEMAEQMMRIGENKGDESGNTECSNKK